MRATRINWFTDLSQTKYICANDINKLSMQLPEKDKENFDVSSDGLEIILIFFR